MATIKIDTVKEVSEEKLSEIIFRILGILEEEFEIEEPFVSGEAENEI